MRYLVLAILPFVAIFLQSTLFSIYSIKGAMPDLILIFVVFHALLSGNLKGSFYGFLCGLLEDLYMGRFIGLNALSKALVGYVVGRLQGVVFKENLLVGIIGVLVGTLLNTLAMFVVEAAVNHSAVIDQGILYTILYMSIYNMLLAAPTYIWYYNSSRHGLLRPSGER
ncbi:rod shape-determining protein MreD [Syntrophomonas erecta]